MIMVSTEPRAMRKSETVFRESGDGSILLSSGSVEVGSVGVGVTECITVELCNIASMECVGEEEARIAVVGADKM